MNVYVETNFVLELVFEQAQNQACEQILRRCEHGLIRLVLPAYCLAEPHEKLHRQRLHRVQLQKELQVELRQLGRTSLYGDRVDHAQDILNLLAESNQRERERFSSFRERLLTLAEIVPLTAVVLQQAAVYEELYEFTPQDALVFASVRAHLAQQKPPNAISCFLNRNVKDFKSPDVIAELDHFSCRFIANFDDGYRFINAQA